MRLIATKTLRAYALRRPDTRASIDRLIEVLDAVAWTSMQDVIDGYPSAKAINGERARFEIQGGRHRLIIAFHFRAGIAYVKFIGTHREYDRIDATTVSLFRGTGAERGDDQTHS